jgi:diamine N-acetyltransferase
LKLRAIEPEDLSFFYKWENDTTLWSMGDAISPYSKYIIKAYIESSDKDIYTNKQLRLMIDLKGIDKVETVGCIDIFDFDVFHQRAAIGILIDKEHRQKGLGTEALHLIINYCLSFLKLQQLYCHIPINNKESLALFQKVGFSQSGELSSWIKTLNGYINVSILQLVSENK